MNTHLIIICLQFYISKMYTFIQICFRMEPASAEKLLKAFQILDVDGKGTISKDYIAKLMSEEGEPFTQVSALK